ncbi:MAG: hypothetical protein H0T83_08300 [Chthoniobacterales bacterium]|nr:hypothetical protein [Chthoniobacterales bacterium]
MKTIAVNRNAIASAAIVMLATVAITWVIARSTAQSDVATVRKEIAACEQRAAAKLALGTRVANTAVVTSRRANERAQELEIKNKQLQQEIEGKAQETPVAKARVPRSRAERRYARKATATSPQQTFELSSGEQKSIIPGVLSVSVDKLDPTSAEVDYGGHPRHLNVGDTITVSYLGRPCVLALTEIKGDNNGAPTGSFAFSVAAEERFAVEPDIPAEGPTP